MALASRRDRHQVHPYHRPRSPAARAHNLSAVPFAPAVARPIDLPLPRYVKHAARLYVRYPAGRHADRVVRTQQKVLCLIRYFGKDARAGNKLAAAGNNEQSHRV